jgi:hypothetical protein
MRRTGSLRKPGARTAATAAAELRQAERWMRIAWVTGVGQAFLTAALLLATGRNLLLSAHYPLVSALAVLLLALGVRRGSRAAAVLLTAGVLAPSLIKLLLGALQPVDLPAFPLAALYALGTVATFRSQRVRKGR